jgi:hypothetical protein
MDTGRLTAGLQRRKQHELSVNLRGGALRFVNRGESGSRSHVFHKHGVHIVADAVTEVVADDAYSIHRAIRALRSLADSWALIFRACSNIRTSASR